MSNLFVIIRIANSYTIYVLIVLGLWNRLLSCHFRRDIGSSAAVLHAILVTEDRPCIHVQFLHAPVAVLFRTPSLLEHYCPLWCWRVRRDTSNDQGTGMAWRCNDPDDITVCVFGVLVSVSFSGCWSLTLTSDTGWVWYLSRTVHLIPPLLG